MGEGKDGAETERVEILSNCVASVDEASQKRRLRVRRQAFHVEEEDEEEKERVMIG